MESNRMAENPKKESKTARSIALSALLFALTIVLTTIEHAFPSIITWAPGIKLGLSNIVVMYALFFLGKSEAVTIAFLKGFFVLATRGFVAGILSLTGGFCSQFIMILIMLIFKDNASYFILSVLGAVFHNLGQYLAFYMLYPNVTMWVYVPILLIAGVVAGAVTAKLLSVILPVLERLGLNKK